MKNYFRIFSEDRDVTVLLVLLIFITLFYSIDEGFTKVIAVLALSMFFLQQCFKYTLLKDLERYRMEIRKESDERYKRALSLETAKIISSELGNARKGLRSMLDFRLGSWNDIREAVAMSLNRLKSVHNVNDLLPSPVLWEKLGELVKLVGGAYLMICWLREESAASLARTSKGDIERLRLEQERIINIVLLKKAREFERDLRREVESDD